MTTQNKPQGDALREALANRIRAAMADVRRKSYPLADLIPMMQEAADALSQPPAPEQASGELGVSETLRLQMELNEWRSYLTGLCVGDWPKTAKEAHDNVKERIRKLQAKAATPTAEPAAPVAAKPVDLSEVGKQFNPLGQMTHLAAKPDGCCDGKVSALCPGCPRAVSKTEQQAQAGEPPVYRLMSLHGMDEFITLQSHREAMWQGGMRAKAIIDAKNEAIAVLEADFAAEEAINSKLLAEIAKQAAALQACVEALKSYSKSPYIKKQHPKRFASGNAAITQAQKALK